MAAAPLLPPQFPRTEKYNPEWLQAHVGGGANPLKLTEWLAEKMDLRPGMRVLDLGCGPAASSIFLAREFGTQVWAVDLWTPADINLQRIQNAGVADRVFPLHMDARMLSFAGQFFDAIFSVDAYMYLAGDPLYLNYLAHFVKENGQIGVTGAGFTQEMPVPIPEHLQKWWTQDLWALMTPQQLAHLWGRTEIVAIEIADHMPAGHEVWLDWHRQLNPNGSVEIDAIAADAGRYLGYIRVVARRQPGAKLEPYCWPDPIKTMPFSTEFVAKPVMKES